MLIRVLMFHAYVCGIEFYNKFSFKGDKFEVKKMIETK